MLTTRPPVLPSGSNRFSRSWLFGAVVPRIYFIYLFILTRTMFTMKSVGGLFNFLSNCLFAQPCLLGLSCIYYCVLSILSVSVNNFYTHCMVMKREKLCFHYTLCPSSVLLLIEFVMKAQFLSFDYYNYIVVMLICYTR